MLIFIMNTVPRVKLVRAHDTVIENEGAGPQLFGEMTILRLQIEECGISAFHFIFADAKVARKDTT